MNSAVLERLPAFLRALGLEEEPMGVHYSDQAPAGGFSPDPMDLPTREKEAGNAIDWGRIFGNFSCALGHIWRARKKRSAAFFSAQRFGCPGCAFWLGFNKPQAELIIHYVSTGIPGRMPGEHYCDSPDALRRLFEQVDPRPAPGAYCIFKPVGLFAPDEKPEFVSFFCRPESLCGLHQLATYVTNDPEVVASPWSAACGGLVVWPAHYSSRGQTRAVLGGWDPSARKFFKTDELSFTVPFAMFEDMLRRFDDSFLKTPTWETVARKIARSRKAWGEDAGSSSDKNPSLET